MARLIRCYTELSRLKTFEERFEYLKLNGQVGSETFGFDRWINQVFYKSKEWQWAKDKVILRDNGCDLGIKDRPINKIYIKQENGLYREVERVIVHHMNPITLEDIENREPWILDPEYLITTVHNTHQAIHYGDANLLMPSQFVERKPNDTCPWK